jgi:hypothetical protein
LIIDIYQQYIIIDIILRWLSFYLDCEFLWIFLGVRLIGPKLSFSRETGGEGGSHPSNVNDNPYAIGAINFTGITILITITYYTVTYY